MVRMWPPRVLLRCSIMAASVVDLPEPVAPTTRISPRFSMIRSFRIDGSRSASMPGVCVRR